MCNLDSVVAVLQLLHVASHLLEGLLLVHLAPVHTARLHLVKQLSNTGEGGGGGAGAGGLHEQCY